MLGIGDRDLEPNFAIQRHETTSLQNLYWKYFDVLDADTKALRNHVFRIRHQVYCVEHSFEKPNRDGLERDAFDAHAAHALLIHREANLVAGSLRMVLPVPDALDRSFAVQQMCTDSAIRDPKRLPLDTMGEISRLCMPRDLIHRARPRWNARAGGSGLSDAEWKRLTPHLTLGLFEWLVRFSRRVGLTHWCAVMEPPLLRRLARLGFHAQPLGGLVVFHGVRQPIVVEMEAMLRRMRAERPDVWEVLTGARARSNDRFTAIEEGTALACA
jgi:N-acyl amino acid synthase of PEP-CTERM/exosortase system